MGLGNEVVNSYPINTSGPTQTIVELVTLGN